MTKFSDSKSNYCSLSASLRSNRPCFLKKLEKKIYLPVVESFTGKTTCFCPWKLYQDPVIGTRKSQYAGLETHTGE